MTDKEMIDNLLNNLFTATRQSGKSRTVKEFVNNIMKTCPEVFSRMENKRKESVFNNFWNKECLMDLVSSDNEEFRMEILSAYYISDNGKDGKIVFDVSFNCYKLKKYHDNDRCEFFIDYNPSKDKLNDTLISLYYEIEDLYERKVISLKKFSEFFNIKMFEEEKEVNDYMDLLKNIYNVLKEDGFKIPVEESRWKPEVDSFDRINNNTVRGAFGDTNNIKNLKGDKMDIKNVMEELFGKDFVEKASKVAENLKSDINEAVEKVEDKVKDKVKEVKPSIDEAVEKAKCKTKSVFDKISTEIGEKTKTYKGSFNALKEAVKNKEGTNSNRETYSVTLSPLEVFVANKVEICHHILNSIEKYKMAILGRHLEIGGMPLNEDSELVIKNTDFVDMLEQILSEDGLIDDEFYLDNMEFVTRISFEGVENYSYFVAKISIGELADIFIKFIPVDYEVNYSK